MTEEGQPSQTELLKEFYASGASNFKMFMEKRQKASGGASTKSKGYKGKEAAKPRSPVQRADETTTPVPGSATAPAAPSPTPQPQSSGQMTKEKKEISKFHVKKSLPPSSSPKETPTNDSITTPSFQDTKNDSLVGSYTAGEGAASNEYMEFLKQQQELQKCHQKLDEIISTFERDRREHQADLGKVRGQANELLGALEEGTNWNLSSKYNINTLIKDARLKLYPQELYQFDQKSQYLDIVQQAANLTKLREDHGSREPFAVFKSLFDHGGRRLERIEKELRTSQLDATEMSRLPDALFVQLDHVLGSPTIHEVLQSNEEALEDLLFKLEDTKAKRMSALDNGEMMCAERHYYEVVHFYEQILEIVLEKLRTTDEIKKKQQVFDKVRDQYQQKASKEAERLRQQKGKLKQQCEADLKRIFSLKEHVDSVEASTAKKLVDERKASDEALTLNASKIEGVWAKIEELEKELEGLEKERFKEVKKRIHDKDNDEHRRMEYETFCQVVDKHCQLLDLTIRNCDCFEYTTTLLSEFVNTGFNTLGANLNKQDRDHSDLLLETHRQHLEMFRGLYLGLGELVHKKEKQIQDVEDRIKTNHIQQELAMDTFNPSAKKFSDAKKILLKQRDDIEAEVNDLKEKAQNALRNFRISEDALHAAGIEFVHPVIEQQEEELEMKAKMVEYKAISIGHVDAVPIKAELEELKAQMAQTKRVVESVNASALSSSLPAIRAKTPPNHSVSGPV